MRKSLWNHQILSDLNKVDGSKFARLWLNPYRIFLGKWAENFLHRRFLAPFFIETVFTRLSDTTAPMVAFNRYIFLETPTGKASDDKMVLSIANALPMPPYENITFSFDSTPKCLSEDNSSFV